MEVPPDRRVRGGCYWCMEGGAGDVEQGEAAGRIEGCRSAAGQGALILGQGGSALDAVEQAVRALEDDPRTEIQAQVRVSTSSG